MGQGKWLSDPLVGHVPLEQAPVEAPALSLPPNPEQSGSRACSLLLLSPLPCPAGTVSTASPVAPSLGPNS